MTQSPPNTFKRALAEGRQQLGFWLGLGSATAAEIVAEVGFDWLMIDMEHTSVEIPVVLDLLRALKGGTAEPMVRVPWNEPVMVKRLLDIGVRTFLFPMVHTPDEARAGVAATRYPPQGIRGVAAATRATHYGRNPDYFTRAADDICVVVQIESVAAVERIPEIAAVEGVDGLFIGPQDLAADMGLVGQRYAEKNKEMILKGLDLVQQSGKAAGIVEYNAEEAMRLVKAGFTFVAVGGDVGMLARGTEALVKAFRPELTRLRS